MGASKKRILVVDDDEIIREVLIAALDAAGYDVVATDDKQALQTACANPPAIILLDLMMPTHSGEALCRQLRAQPSTAAIPIIAMSAGRDPAVTVGLGMFNASLPKPFSLRLLVHLIEHWTGAPQRERRDAAKPKALCGSDPSWV